MKNLKNLPLRPCAGIMLLNHENKVFVGARIDVKSQYWQMPQGGIDEGETPLDAAFRELKEEIGTNNAMLLQESNHWYDYDLPPDLLGKIWGGQYRGQRQKWFAMRFLGQDHEINLETDHPEFCDWKWLAIDQLVHLCLSFKRPVYRQVVDEFSHIILKSLNS